MKYFSIRTNCVICDNILNKILFNNDLDMISNPYVKDSNISNDIIIPYNIYVCENCGIYQNKYLGNLDIVYNKNHNNILTSNTWINHYNIFYNFIKKKNILNTNTKILEIGGGNNYLGELLLKDTANYYILEPNVTNKNKDIIYIEDWIETYNSDYNYDILILSHVLEHLYNPSEIFKFKSKYICISIPNLKKYVDNIFINVLNIEHTFYYEDIHIINLFLKNNYKLINNYYYLEHSIFMIFEYDNNINLDTTKLELYNNEIKLNIKIIFDNFFKEILDLKDKINILLNNNLNDKYAIFPCNHYIQYLYTFGLEINKIDYLYDNNINKFNKKLYGTNLICKNIDFFKNNNIKIILIGSLYNLEILDNLKINNIEYFIF